MELATHLSEIDLSKCIYPIEINNKKYFIDKDPEVYAKQYVEKYESEKIQKRASEIQWNYYIRNLEILSTQKCYLDAIYEIAGKFLTDSLKDGTFIKIYQNDFGIIKEDIEQYQELEEKNQDIEIDRG